MKFVFLYGSSGLSSLNSYTLFSVHTPLEWSIQYGGIWYYSAVCLNVVNLHTHSSIVYTRRVKMRVFLLFSLLALGYSAPIDVEERSKFTVTQVDERL